ncbi:hypothetical protein Ddc_24750 [Ditylenchus destructor]|nr:hypothetical protein Ddc_24750 [Ditylenchus destructor]
MHLPHPREGHGRRRGARLDAQLDVDALEVLLHGGRAAAEDLADVPVGLALDHPVEHLPFPRRQAEKTRPSERITAASDTSRMTISQSPPTALVVPVAPDAPLGASSPPMQWCRRKLSRRAPSSALRRGGSCEEAAAVPSRAASARAGAPWTPAPRCSRSRRHRAPAASAALARALQMHLHPRQHRARVERLGDVIDAARLQGGHQMLRLRQPVMKTMGMCAVTGLALSRRATSKPSMPGIIASSSTMSGWPCSALASAASPLVAASTV